MSVNSEIQRISTAVADAYDAVDTKGGILPASEVVANLKNAILSIPIPEDGNNMKYGTSSYLIGVAKIGTGYVWTTYSGDDIGIVGSAETETAVAV